MRAFEPEGEVRAVETPAGEAAVAVHVGPYDRMKETHDAIHAWRFWSLPPATAPSESTNS